MLKLTLLSIALLTVFGSAAVAPTLAEIAQSFPDNSATEIKALLTAPALMMIFISPLTSFFSGILGHKKLVIIALLCYLIGGLAGGIAPTYNTLFLTRLLLGVGIGILMPMSTVLVAQNFTGKERLQLLGWASSATNLFGIAAGLVVGFLAVFSWRYGFLIYGIAALTLALVLFYLPSTANEAKQKNAAPKILPLSIYLWAAAIFLQMIAIYGLLINIALFVNENQLGNAREAGIGYASMTLAGFTAGILGVHLRSLFEQYFAPAILLLSSIGFYVLIQSTDITSLIIAILIVGFASGVLMPFLLYSVTNAAGSDSTVAAMGMVATVAAAAQFVTPFIIDSIAMLLGDGSTRSAFVTLGSATAISCGLSFVVIAWQALSAKRH